MDKNEKKNNKILRQMNAEKAKNERKIEKDNNKKTPKEHIRNFSIKVKEVCIKDTSRMILLVAILVAVYVVINLWVRSINLAQIDLTKDKLYTLTDQSKTIVKQIDKEITFYVWEYTEDSQLIDLLKQYNAQNSKIKYEIVSTDDVEKIKKYAFETDYPEILGEAEDGRMAYISSSDLYTYDSNFNIVDLTEQKITNAIVNLSSTKSTKVYFLEGKSSYTIENGLYCLNEYLSNEYYEVGTINIVADPKIPEDCDVLAIMGLDSDLTETEASSICKYIEDGGDLIITNDIDSLNTERNYPNFQKVLDEYDISMPNKLVHESSSNTIAGYSDIVIQANIASDHEITRLLYNYTTSQSGNVKPIFLASGIINLDLESMFADNITSSSIVTSSTNATLTNLATEETERNDGTPYVLGAAIQKTVESGEESRLVIFATTSSFSDDTIDSQTPMFYYNANIILNSFAFASNRGELYSIRKSSQYTTYEPTEQQDQLVRIIISAIPVAIAVLGICVWFNRRKLK